MKYIKLFEKWEQSSTESIICPHCLTHQHHLTWEICPKWTSYWDCESCNKEFFIEKECTYYTSKI